jgi:hypothetical protein
MIDSAIHAEKSTNYPQIGNSDSDLPSLERFYLRFP